METFARHAHDDGVLPRETVRLMLNTVTRTYNWQPKPAVG
jgi:hypothetical protein